MLKKLLYILLLYICIAEKVDIANCNELWGMSNSMNKQTVYSMKIYSCIVEPNFEFNKKLITTTTNNTTTYNTTTNNTTTYNTTTNNTNNTTTYNTNTNNTTTYNTNNTTTYNTNNTGIVTPSSSYGSSPSSKTNKNIDNIDNINQEDIVELNYNSPSPSSYLNIKNNELDIGLIIGIVVSSCIITSLTIFGIIFYNKKKLINNEIQDESLKSRAQVTRPHILNTSSFSSKTDETAPISPHSPLSTNISVNKHLPDLPLSDDNNVNLNNSDNDNSNNMIDIESGYKDQIEPTDTHQNE